MSASSWKLVMSRVDRGRIADIRDTLQQAFEIGQGQANDIVNHVPIILIDNLASREQGEEIIDRLADVTAVGAIFSVTDESLAHTPKLTWPDMPTVARTESYKAPKKKKDDEDHEQITMTKYNFVVNTEHVFHCPDCGAAWRLTPLTPEEKEDALGQRDIARILGQQKGATRRPSGQVAPASQGEFEPVPDSGLAAAGDSPMDMGDFERRLSDYSDSHVIKSEEAAAPEEIAASGNVPPEESGEVIFEALEALPEAKPAADAAGARLEEVPVRPVDEKEADAFELSEPVLLEAVGGTAAGALHSDSEVELVEIQPAGGKKESALDPNEALALFGKTREKHETRKVDQEQFEKAMKEADAQGIPELEALPDELLPDEDAPVLTPIDDGMPTVEGDLPVLPPVADEPPELEAIDEEPPVLTPIDNDVPVLPPVPGMEPDEPEKKPEKKIKPMKGPKPRKGSRMIKKKDAGSDSEDGARYSFVLSKVAGAKKREKAADLISELKGISKDEAYDMLEGSFTKVLKGATKNEAESVLEKFKSAGLTGRVTKQRR